jgi:hypothetical protein
MDEHLDLEGLSKREEAKPEGKALGLDVGCGLEEHLAGLSGKSGRKDPEDAQPLSEIDPAGWAQRFGGRWRSSQELLKSLKDLPKECFPHKRARR